MKRVVLGWILPAVLVGSCLFVGKGSHGEIVYQPTSKQEQSLKKALQGYLGPPYPSEVEDSTRYIASFVHLEGDRGQQVIVYVTGGSWCGSGGCTTVVLTKKGPSYSVVARLTITRRPIRVLTAKSNGWHDISVWMQGGGIQPGYEADFFFDGKTYRGRDEATLRPSKRLRQRVLPGKTVIPRTAPEEGKRLYPN